MRDVTGYLDAMSSPDPTTTQSDAGSDGLADVVSDPAKGADGPSDWSDEGGATPAGEATDVDED